MLHQAGVALKSARRKVTLLTVRGSGLRMLGDTCFPGVDMAHRETPHRGTSQGLFRYGVWALVLIAAALIIYLIANGGSTPGPDVRVDSTVAPKVNP